MIKSLKKSRVYNQILEQLKTFSVELKIGGLWGSADSYFLAGLHESHPKQHLLVIVPQTEDAENTIDDLVSFLPASEHHNIHLFPHWDRFLATSLPDSFILRERLKTLLALTVASDQPTLVVASIQACLQPVPRPEVIKNAYYRVNKNSNINLDELVNTLTEKNWARLEKVTASGEFSLRGGIIDIYPYECDRPVRLELVGNTIESIRSFDPETQLSDDPINEISFSLIDIGNLYQSSTTDERVSLLDYLNTAKTFSSLKEPAQIQETAQHYSGLLERSELSANYSWQYSASRERDPAYTGKAELPHYQEQSDKRDGFPALLKQCQDYPCLWLHALPLSQEKNHFNFHTKSLQRFSSLLGNLPNELANLRKDNNEVIIFCHNQAEEKRIKEVLEKSSLGKDRGIRLLLGGLTKGFQFTELKTVFTSSAELFNRTQLRQYRGRARCIASTTRPIDLPAGQAGTFLELEPGDFVVHLEHGIGRYQGIKRLHKEDYTQEFLKIEFDESALVYVPITQIELVQKYVGGTDQIPHLSRLGTLAWSGKKERARQAAQQLAHELLTIQAMREQEPGIAYPIDTDWQTAFEAAFPYVDTPDQVAVTEVIKKDMIVPHPMDRLVCGDVGYGKTELAMRAAFKVVTTGRQVAVLVPTTILAEQHYQNFKERMASYPVNVEMLSRFRNKQEQSDIIKRLADSEVDIIIGTHRLVQPDVKFKNLGLIVIDEEQRFGVEHKERLKKLRATVDILTLTATPIPRTLHMSLLGIRDISTLATPPLDRHAVETQLVRFSPTIIREGIRNELDRKGQVYFVHNRIYDIQIMAENIHEIVPEAKLTIVHGQLHEDLIEERMHDFVEGKIDVLLSTNIIESGLDIPRVNTIFINNADRFGLADLHQLRGRVGRYKHQAYAYLLLPEGRPIAPDAEKRLKAIQEFNELGSGFKIALRDMEIRGVGNILGPEQHGYITSIGYDLYCKLLETSVKTIRNQPIATTIEVSIDLPIDAFLPTEYIASERQRIELYRKLSRVGTKKEIKEIEGELKDRFGISLPASVRHLVSLARLRLLAQKWGIHSLSMGSKPSRERIVVARYRNQIKAQRLKKTSPRTVRIVDDATMHFYLPQKAIKTPEGLLVKVEELLGGR